MKRRRPAVDYLVYLAVRLLVAVCQALSVEQSYRVADFLAAVLYRVDKRHRMVGLENLRMAFGDQYTEAQRDQIIRGVYRHFLRMVMEMLHIPRKLHSTTWRDRIALVRYTPLLDRLLKGGPLIMLTGHFGNWEMAGYLFGLYGFPPNSVARTLDNPYLDRFVRSFRERTGQRMISKKGGSDEILDVLNRGGVMSFLADQDAGQNGMYVDFFGKPASTHKSIAILALQHNAPVVVGFARRTGPGFRYEVGCELIIEPGEFQGSGDDVKLLTQRYTTALERIVRRDPEQYLWLHRRWKHQPKPRGRAKAQPLAGEGSVAIDGIAAPAGG
ncbi:MAG: Lauroyl/myristoyl acyltransferase [Planctomycetota bacterium]|nr:Lauroyl/myristoyl acyltransferase [Planctomycetota bacterium]